jgi:cytosine/adenosine deaminase-related metal-dependent hydrolase/ubiquinone/menaquinone biosynthesis C-methylase UbiE
MNPQMNVSLLAPSESDSSVFDLWAQVYDSQLNPLLMLEERELAPLLPSLESCDVLDVGCGTGRWLSRLEKLGPASLSGIDSSPAMLRYARQKVSSANLLCQDLSSEFSIGASSKDLILSSFVLSYLGDLQKFAYECARITRPGGYLLLSDMHPATAVALVWKRSFSLHGEKIEIPIRQQTLQEIISVFQNHSLDVQTLIEPAFDLPERGIFESADKLADFESLAGVPAIYILKLRKRVSNSPILSGRTRALRLAGARIARGPETWQDGVLKIEGERISSIKRNDNSLSVELDLSGYIILPGLINAHDHLEFGLFPNLGRNAETTPYQNSSEWAYEIHRIHSAIIERRQLIPKSIHVWWGAIRNLLSGVTTVCHHNPLHPDLELSGFPVQVVSRFGWAHSLKFEPHIRAKFLNTPLDHPFIIHAAEGIDADSFNEIGQLDRMHLLGERTVLVHGLALNAKTISLLNKRGTSIVACPTSNLFLFSRTLSRDQFNSVRRIALGSDSPLTADGDLLNEIHYLRSELALDPNIIYKMVTSNAAEMLRLNHGEGQLTESGIANMIAVRAINKTPASTLSELNFIDIELVVRTGRIVMASQNIYERLPHAYRKNMQCLEVEGQRRWFSAPLRKLVEEAEKILGHDNLRIGGRQVHYLDVI